MSNQMMSWATEVRGLHPTTKCILMLLADHHHKENGCFPGIDTLTRESNLKRRSVLYHLKKLEDGKLIERETKSLGRGKGKKTYFHFNLVHFAPVITSAKPKRVAPVTIALNTRTKIRMHDGSLQVQHVAPVKHCTCKLWYLQVQPLAPAYKEEPELTGNTPLPPEGGRFEEAWKLYQSCPLKVGQTKKDARSAWKRAVDRAKDPQRIIDAIEIEVQRRQNPSGFVAKLPDMHRWLKKDRWEDVERSEAERTQPQTARDYTRHLNRWIKQHVWPEAACGPAPNLPSTRVPVDQLEAALSRMPEDDERRLTLSATILRFHASRDATAKRQAEMEM